MKFCRRFLYLIMRTFSDSNSLMTVDPGPASEIRRKMNKRICSERLLFRLPCESTALGLTRTGPRLKRAV